MATCKVEYLGGLRTKCTHTKSGVEIFTDAPIDNNGKGECFSPTDLVAAAYSSCMITIIGIYCETNNIVFEHCTSEVDKIMTADPRRIGELQINLDFQKNQWGEDIQKRIIRAGEACPVAKTVDQSLSIKFNYQF